MPQYRYPAVDITLDGGAGGADPARMWTDPSYPQIDEAGTADDGDYTSSPSVPTAADYLEVKFEPASDPGVNTGHVIRYRYRKNLAGGARTDVQAKLYQGSTLIASGTLHTDISESWTDGSFTLSEVEAAEIADYTDLRVRIIATQVGS